MYKWWIYAVPRWHCVALGCKDSYWTSCMPFSQTLCLYWPLRSVKKTRAKNSFWFHIWFDQFLMLNTQSFCPTKHSAIPFCVKQLLSSATFDLWSTKLGSKAFANTSGIRHSCHPWFCLGTTLHNRFPKQYNLEKQWLPCPKDSWHLPGDGTHHFVHSLRTWNARDFFFGT